MQSQIATLLLSKNYPYYMLLSKNYPYYMFYLCTRAEFALILI